MLKENLVDVIATDTHSIDRRPPVLSEAVKAASKICGADRAMDMVDTLPRRILGI